MRPPRLSLAWCAAAVAATALSGCGGNDPEPRRNDSNATPVSITVAVDQLPTTLDPARASSVSERAIAVAVHTPLLTYRRSGDTDAATLEPALARDLPTVSGDKTEYRFMLRPGLLYADGRVVTASDVERSISHASVHASDPEVREALDGIVGAPSTDGETLSGVVTDDRTGAIVVRLRKPDGRIPLALADPATAPLPELPPATGLTALPASTGPLRVARVTASSVELVANPLRARISTVPAAVATQVSVTDRAVTPASLRSGSVDLDLQPSAEVTAPRGVTSLDASSGAVWSLLLPPTGMLEARTTRQAIANAIDRRGLADVAAGASGTGSGGVGGTTSSAGGSGSDADATTTPATASNRTTPTTPDAAPEQDGGLAPACGLLPAYVVGAVIRDDCPPAPTISKSAPLAGDTLRIAVTGGGLGDVATSGVVSAAITALGGRAVFVTSKRPAAAITDHRADVAIVRAAPVLPEPAGWLAPAATVDALLARQVPVDQAAPLTGSDDKWSALETRAVDRAVAIPLAVGRTTVLVGGDIERGSVLLHPVLGLDLTSLAPR